MKKVLFILMLIFSLTVATSLYAASFYASTDRVSYTGSVTTYNSLSDAQSNTNSTGGPYGIPGRDTASPYNTAYRDAGIFIVQNQPNYYSNSNIFLTSWWYTTVENTNGYPKDHPDGDRLYSGWGNPNNTNTGFLQLYDADSSTITSAQGNFGSYNGTYYTTFSLQLTGQNAINDTSDPSNDWARLWNAPNTGGAASLTKGKFHSYSLDLTFGGLEGSVQGDMIKSINHPTSITGSFQAIFENTNTVDTSLNGFYRVDYTFGMDNWAFGQGDAALNGNFSTSEFGSPVPIPGALLLLGAGLVRLAAHVRRRPE